MPVHVNIEKKLNDCKLKLGIFKYPNIRMQRGIFWPTPGQNQEVTPVGKSIHIPPSYRCLHLVCVQSPPTKRSLSSTSLQTGFCPATWFYFIFVIVAFNKSLLWCIRVDNDICTWIVIAHVKKCLDFVFVFLKWMEMVFFFFLVACLFVKMLTHF